MLDAEVPRELSLICLRNIFELLFSSMLILFDEVNFDAGDYIFIAKSFSHALFGKLGRRGSNCIKKKGDFADENHAITESNIEETFNRLETELKKTLLKVFDALSVTLVNNFLS
jgi:phosphoenolpyruvate carboxylase